MAERVERAQLFCLKAMTDRSCSDIFHKMGIAVSHQAQGISRSDSVWKGDLR